MGKKFKRRDGFRGEKLYCWPHPLTINPTEKDVIKRIIEKRTTPKKK